MQGTLEVETLFKQGQTKGGEWRTDGDLTSIYLCFR